MIRLKHAAFIGLLLFLTLFPVLQAGTVTGVVRNSAGILLANQKISFSGGQTLGERIILSDLEGRFRIELKAGTYRVFHLLGEEKVFLQELLVSDTGDHSIEPVVEEYSDKTLDAIREFRVGYSTLNSDAYQNLAEMINPFPDKGKGWLYGSVYEFHRNDNFDARNFFDPVGEPLPEYKRNQFGVTVGAILSPHLTLQANYDGLRIIQGSTEVSHVPTQLMRTGNFSELDEDIIDPITGNPFPGNQIPSDRIHPVAFKVLEVIPAPNLNDFERNFVNNDPFVNYQDNFSTRMDYTAEDNSKVIVNYSFTDRDRNDIDDLPAFTSARSDRYQAFSVSFNKTLSERLVSYSRLTFNRSRSFGLSPNSENAGLLDSLGISGLILDDSLEEGYPDFNLSGYANPGDGSNPTTAVRNRLELDLSFTYAINNHSIRFGTEIGGNQLNNYRSGSLHRGRFNFSGEYTGDGFADYLLGVPNIASKGVGTDRADLRRKYWEFFVRESWKIHPKFDITMGITYSFQQPYHSITDNVSSFYPMLFEPPLDGQLVSYGTEVSKQLGFAGVQDGTLIFPDKNNWAPSISVAYSPLGSNQLVIRGSYSLFYDPPDERDYSRRLTRNYPFFYITTAESLEDLPSIDLSNPFRGATPPAITVQGIAPHLTHPYFHFWRMSAQNEIAPNWNVEAEFTGRKGVHTNRVIPANVPEPGEGDIQERRPNPEYGKFSIFDNGGSYSANEFRLSMNKRFSKGFSLNSGMIWNKILTTYHWGDPNNPRDLASEKGSASWQPEKRFYLRYIIDIPAHFIFPWRTNASLYKWLLDGWRLSGITDINGGRPFTVVESSDPNNDGVYGDRPDRIGSGEISSPNPDQWFNTADFVAAQPYSFGNSGRGILKGPGHQTWDISVIKQTRLNQGDIVELRIALFNAFNNVNFDNPVANINDDSFGTIFGADRAREIEVALKYSF
jgi:hypothetical protein